MTIASSSAAWPAATRRAGFRRGVSNPTPLVLLASLALAALALIGLQYLVTSGMFTLVPESHFLRQPSDDWGHVTYQVGRLKLQPPRRTPVYLVGGSNVRVSVVSEASMAKAIEQRAGVPVRVFDFGSNEQTFGESMAIIDNLPRTGGIVVLGVNQTRFSYSPAFVGREVGGRRLVMLSPALARFMASHGVHSRYPQTILPGIFDFIGTWLQYNRANLARLTFRPVYYLLQPVYRVYSRARKTNTMMYYLRHDGHTGGTFDQNFAFNAALLDATVRLAKQRGFTVVLMESPENRQIVGSHFDRLKNVYQPFCRALAARDGATYVDFNDQVGLVDTDFHDLTHLMPWGRPKWQRGLAAALAPLLTAQKAAVSP